MSERIIGHFRLINNLIEPPVINNITHYYTGGWEEADWVKHYSAAQPPPLWTCVGGLAVGTKSTKWKIISFQHSPPHSAFLVGNRHPWPTPTDDVATERRRFIINFQINQNTHFPTAASDPPSHRAYSCYHHTALYCCGKRKKYGENLMRFTAVIMIHECFRENRIIRVR